MYTFKLCNSTYTIMCHSKLPQKVRRKKRQPLCAEAAHPIFQSCLGSKRFYFCTAGKSPPITVASRASASMVNPGPAAHVSAMQRLHH